PAERANRAVAMAGSPYDSAGRMYAMLPALYLRYDTLLPPAPTPPAMDPADAQRGQLRRLLDLPGGQLDLLRSFARTLLDIHDLDRVDGRLLPLLAQWIGWRTDYSQEIGSQRSEIRAAPALYRTSGVVANLEATVRRVIGRESRTKEIVHNVLRSNTPERLTLWRARRGAGGIWEQPSLFSVDAAPAGRPCPVRTADGALHLFFQAQRQGRSQIWYKATAPGDETAWGPGQPLSQGDLPALDPVAVASGGTIWAFWSVYDPGSGRWRIDLRTRPPGGPWAPTQTFGGADPERRAPAAAVDDAGGVWLFWLEREGAGWTMRYSRNSAGAWSAPVELPPDGGRPPRVEADPFLLFHPAGGGTPPLWIFWVRHEPAATPGRSYATIVMRTKANLNADAGGWSAIMPVSALPPAFDEREPSAPADGATGELFHTSEADGSPSLASRGLNIATGVWSAPQPLSAAPFTQRAPAAVLGADLWLFFRSNESLRYTSQVYGSTSTTDGRYAGGTSVQTANGAKLALRGRYDDFQTYSYSTGPGGAPGDGDLYARDAVGVYWDPNTAVPALALRSSELEQVKRILREFLPIQVRAIFIKDPDA
ncbi:MAG: hypothetical protein HGA45_42160, partial [Chloroflexales bacterium]|nr:hypothetical protein [Chloroflexales bacterium]